MTTRGPGVRSPNANGVWGRGLNHVYNSFKRKTFLGILWIKFLLKNIITAKCNICNRGGIRNKGEVGVENSGVWE